MCVIIDTNVAGMVFGKGSPRDHTDAILSAIDDRGLKLVSGGKLHSELLTNSSFVNWWRERRRSGSVHSVDKNRIEKEHQAIEAKGGFVSNDVHILALARASGARLLITADKALHKDFKNQSLIPGRRGKIYNMQGQSNQTLRPAHRKLLARRDLCKMK